MPYNFREISYIPGLNAVRAFAVIIVMLAHFGFENTIPGGFGVTVFFFLSGFLITTLLNQELKREDRVSLGGFYFRRFLRLMPELTVFLLAATFYRSVLGAPPHFAEVASAFTYTTNYVAIVMRNISSDGAIPTWPQLWSLSVEEHYYITFPVIFATIARSNRALLIFFGGVLILCPLWRTIIVSFDWSSPAQVMPYTYMASETRFDSIAFGALFAFVAQAKGRLGEGQRWLAGAGGLLLLLAGFAIRDPFFRETLRYTVQGTGLFLAFAFLYLGKRELGLMRVLESPVLRTLGILSYGTYLWHMEFPFVVEKIFPNMADEQGIVGRIAYALIGVTVSFCVAYVSYRCIFVPVAKYRSQFGRHGALSSGAAVG